VSDELTAFGASELAAGVRERRISASELVEAHIARIESRNGELNALVAVDAERAQAAAKEADAALARRADLGPLHGVPFTAKDQFEVAGLASREASLLFPETVPAHDAAAVARLRAAGGILLGKTNMSELALFPDSVNRLHGATRNPHDPSRSAGGSSGGEACAVAAGLSPLGLGADYGGSIRCPAHFCGVVGLRAGVGAIPAAGHAPHDRTAARTALSTVGPLARTVADLELAFRVLGRPGFEPEPPARIGVYELPGSRPVERACAEAVTLAAAALELPAEVVTPPFQAELESVFDAVTVAETRLALGALLPERLADASPQLAAVWASVEDSAPDLGEYSAALAGLHALAEVGDEWLDAHPILLAPAGAEPAFELGRTDDVFELFAHFKLASALGLPAAVVPVAVPGARLPTGVQIVGRRGHERQVLLVAGMIEDALGGRLAR
jgi:amidase